MNLQEPVSHIVARPSPNDILEWRKFALPFFIFFDQFMLNFMAKMGNRSYGIPTLCMLSTLQLWV